MSDRWAILLATQIILVHKLIEFLWRVFCMRPPPDLRKLFGIREFRVIKEHRFLYSPQHLAMFSTQTVKVLTAPPGTLSNHPAHERLDAPIL
jgi:hypothetical protein